MVSASPIVVSVGVGDVGGRGLSMRRRRLAADTALRSGPTRTTLQHSTRNLQGALPCTPQAPSPAPPKHPFQHPPSTLPSTHQR